VLDPDNPPVPPVPTEPTTPTEADAETTPATESEPAWFKRWSETFDGRLTGIERRVLGTEQEPEAQGSAKAGDSEAEAGTDASEDRARARASFGPPERIPLRTHSIFHRIGR